ncbi:hypothetical protein MNBD_GAMMA21-1432 [hydrothermal vent metagenome]|uniref:HTH marR-type domain-containing protein n=1 Tax=hydrothermal vent metagenome TaxID=652676 RepID=A0A3B1ARA8_9ZZZZ
MVKNNDPIGKLLLLGFRWFDQSLRQSLIKQGWPKITSSQSLLMAYITSDGIRISELARCLNISRQAAQRLVHELNEKGLVRINPDPDNLSAKLVVLSARGQKIVKDALRIFQQLERSICKRVGSKQVKDLREVLEADWGETITVS